MTVTNPYETRDSQQKAFRTADARAKAQLHKNGTFENYEDDALLAIFKAWAFPYELEFSTKRQASTFRRPTVHRSGAVILGKAARTLPDALHQVAHLQTSENFAAHGPEFVQVFLGLLETYLVDTVAAVYRAALETQKMLRFTPSYKPAVAFLNYAVNHGGVGRTVVLVLDDATKLVGEFCGLATSKVDGEHARVARVRQFGQAWDREVPVKALLYAFWPREVRS